MFALNEWHDFQLLPRFFVREHLTLIRNIYFTYSIAAVDPQLEWHFQIEPWPILSSMKSLRKLRVKFQVLYHDFYHTDFWIRRAPAWLRPLKELENLDVLELYLPLTAYHLLPSAIELKNCKIYAWDAWGIPFTDFSTPLFDSNRVALAKLQQWPFAGS